MKIIRVNFTYAMDGGMWIERANGQRDWVSFKVLAREIGDDEVNRLRRVAYHNGWTGMWYDVD